MARLRLTVPLKGKARSRGTRFASRRDAPGHPRPVFPRLSCLSSPASSPGKAGCRVAERRQAGGKAAPATQALARDEPFPRPRRVPRPPRVQTAPRGLSPAAAWRSFPPPVLRLRAWSITRHLHAHTHAHTHTRPVLPRYTFPPEAFPGPAPARLQVALKTDDMPGPRRNLTS